MPPDSNPDPPSLKDPLCEVCGTPLANRLGAQCPRCLLTFATTLGLADESGPPGDDLLDSLQVRKFGDYELLEEIARGGMGVVYRARQISLGREVAVKMILAGELATAESVQRFRNEASAAGQLHHPNIVSVYEIGEHETQHFFSMRLVRGRQNIATWCRALTGADRARPIAGMLARVARAVAFAHERGVLHRDLKPSNILVDDQGEPQVTDFGLAKIVTEHDSALTLSAVMLGSPSYMAPEQADARARDVTTATDVYGLGAVLYELLAGRPPFHGATPFATVRMLLEEMPGPLPEAPCDLATVCLKCLAKEPGQRYPTAAAMADDLERFARGEPIRARPVTLPEAVWRWSRRRPKVAALLGVLALVFVFGFAGVAWQWSRARQANAELRTSVTQLEWRRIVRLLESGDDTVGMAQLARFLRANPWNPRAASLAISVLEQRGFATPAAPALSHGPETFIIQARLSADATRIVTAGSDGTARLWEAATSRPLGEPMRHGGPVRWVEFSPDGRRVATASDDRTARLWDAQSGAPLGPPYVHRGTVPMVKFAGALLATISADGAARLWPASGEPLLLSLGAPGRALAVSADGTRLYTGSASGLQAWTMDGRVLFASPGSVDGLALSPDGARLATWSGKGLRIRDAFTGQEGASLEEMSALGGVAWHPDSIRIAGAATAGWARIWDTATGRPTTPRLEHLYRSTCVAFSPDGHTLLSGGADGAGRRWDAATGAATEAVLNHGEAVIAADYSASGTHLLVVGHPWNDRATPRGGEAQLWDLRRRGLQPWRYRTGGTAGAVAWSADGRFSASIVDGASLAVHEVAQPAGAGDFMLADSVLNGWPRGLSFLPGERLAVVMNSGELGVWSLNTRQRILGPIGEERIEVSRFFADGTQVVVGETSGAVLIRDLASGEIRVRLPSHRAPVNGVAISPDGRFVASVGEDGQCLASTAATGRLLWPAIQSEDEIVSVQFSPDGRWIITAGHDRTARIWEAQTGAPAGAPLWHGGEVVYAEFSPDGTRVLSADRAGTVRIWNPRTGAPLSDPLTHPTALRGACFSPDGRRIATEDHTGLRLWEAATGEPLTLRQPHRTSLGIGFDTQGMHVLFSPDGQRVLQGTASSSVLLWSFPEPPVPSPTWLPDLLESLANLTVNERHAFVPIPQARWLSLRAKLRALPGDDFYARWVRDYCQDPE